MAVTDYNRKKPLEVTSQNDSGATISKAQPVIVKGLSDDASLTSDISADCIYLSPDGTELFTGTISGSGDLVRYTLSTAFDLTTASLTESKGTFNVTGVYFKDDGNIFYRSRGGGYIYEYDTSNFSLDGSLVNSLDTTPHVGSLNDIYFGDGGTKLFLADGENNDVVVYSLSTAWDTTSATYSQTLDVSTNISNLAGIWFKDDGTKMFLPSGGNVFRYSLSTAWDVSTADFDVSVDFSGTDTSITGVATFENENYMFLTGGSSDKFYRFSYIPSDTGDIILDWTNISSESDIAVYDQDGNLLGYEIESFDATAEEAVLWVYGDWVRDDSVQAQVVYGDGPASSEEGSAADVWGNSGQNVEMVQHLNGDPLTATDSSPNGNDGTNNGATLTDGQFDGAASFDGTDDYIDTGGQDVTGAVTSVLWVKPPSIVSSRQSFFSVGYDGGTTGLDWELGGEDLVGDSTLDLRFASYDGSYHSAVLDQNDLSFGSWNHLVGRKSSSSMNIHLDGTDSTAMTEGTNQGASSSPQNRYIGAFDSKGQVDHEFQGDIDEVRLYSETKSSDWIQADYDASPKAGQVFFSQQAAESTVPTTQAIATPTSYNYNINIANTTVEAIRITGTVEVEGSVVQGAYVYAFDKTTETAHGFDTTDANGKYEIGNATSGNTILVATDYYDSGSDTHYGDEKSIVVQNGGGS